MSEAGWGGRLGVTEAGSAGGQWPWGWGQPGLGAVGLGCGLETGRGLGAGRGSPRPGGRPSWVETSQESKKPGGHSCGLRFSPAKGLRPRSIGRSSGHSPCSLGSSSFPEKHLMPLKSREQSPQGVPPAPLSAQRSHPKMRKRLRGQSTLSPAQEGRGSGAWVTWPRVAGTRLVNHYLGCRPADPREWVGCIHLKFLL